ncbi:histidine kinase [Candidatus Aerophobetes bacterium]|uniref:Histidine kinase n=1 Tax=Aerophobetes bacterium TaxID=2030807 RepID=A0A662DAM0_UNCAE|nr:MAG: histidine kinase [Candidatus Aerophobetes bacterium]
MAEEEKIRKIAREEILKQRLEEIKAAIRGWYYHLIIYLVINGAFSAYVLLKGEFFWPIYSIIFWGGGLVLHGIGVFGEKKILTRGMETLKRDKK